MLDRRTKNRLVAPGRRFRDASPSARVLVASCVVVAVLLAMLGPTHPLLTAPNPDALLAVALVASSLASVEFGRWLEGHATVEQRPHKGLSVWAFAAAVDLAPIWLLLIVPLTYAHAYWRALRPAPWKWIGSAAFVVLAALTAQAVMGYLPRPVDMAGQTMVAALAAGVAAYLLVEFVLFFAVSRLNHLDQEVWLRLTLSGLPFYLTEAGSLAVGALTALALHYGPWLLALLVPVFALMQSAGLFEPMRVQAATDDKTRLLRFEPWRQRALREVRHQQRLGQGWAVALVDLDHFKSFNDRHGHLEGDDALIGSAGASARNLRSQDLIGRFGGEEFVVLLPNTTTSEAETICERMRAAIAAERAGELTASIGVAHVAASATHTPLHQALVAADRALYLAKEGGRNTVVVNSVPTSQSVG